MYEKNCCTVRRYPFGQTVKAFGIHNTPMPKTGWDFICLCTCSKNATRCKEFCSWWSRVLGFRVHHPFQGPLTYLWDLEAGYGGVWASNFGGAALGFKPRTSCLRDQECNHDAMVPAPVYWVCQMLIHMLMKCWNRILWKLLFLLFRLNSGTLTTIHSNSACILQCKRRIMRRIGNRPGEKSGKIKKSDKVCYSSQGMKSSGIATGVV